MIAICVGHSRPGDRGAVGVEDIAEHTFWKALAPDLARAVEDRGHRAVVFSRYEGKRYGAAMTWLAGRLRDAGASLAVELHFNWAATRAVAGHEWLYWQGSQRGREAARCLDRAMRKSFPDRPPRGIKSRGPNDDGGGFLGKTHCPAVIAEPFFGSSPADWAAVAAKPALLVETIAAGLADAMAVLYPRPSRP